MRVQKKLCVSCLVRSIDEVVDVRHDTLINLCGGSERSMGRTEDNGWEESCEVKGGLHGFDEVPYCALSERF